MLSGGQTDSEVRRLVHDWAVNQTRPEYLGAVDLQGLSPQYRLAVFGSAVSLKKRDRRVCSRYRGITLLVLLQGAGEDTADSPTEPGGTMRVPFGPWNTGPAQQSLPGA